MSDFYGCESNASMLRRAVMNKKIIEMRRLLDKYTDYSAIDIAKKHAWDVRRQEWAREQRHLAAAMLKITHNDC